MTMAGGGPASAGRTKRHPPMQPLRRRFGSHRKGSHMIAFRHAFFALVLLAGTIGAQASSAVAMPATAEQQLDGIAAQFYRAEWRFAPASATTTGIHDFDRDIQQVSPAAFAAEIASLHAYVAKVWAIPEDGLSLDGQADR